MTVSVMKNLGRIMDHESPSYIAGVTPGGFQNVHEVRILICYLLDSLQTPLTKEQLHEIFQENHLVNYFIFAKAMAELVESNHIRIQPDTNICIVTALGKDAARLLQNSLPRSVRDRVVSSALELQAQFRNQEENEVNITPYQNGYHVTMIIHDTDVDLLHFTIFVPDKLQADIVKKNFLKNPAEFYCNMISALTKNNELS